MNVEIKETEFHHVRAICENLRDRERAAFEQLKATPEKLILQEVARSLVSYTGLIDNNPVVLWGARSAGVFDDSAYIWMVATRALETSPITFLRHSRDAIMELREIFPHLYGLVLADFGCSVRWLEWLGFQVGPAVNGVRQFERFR